MELLDNFKPVAVIFATGLAFGCASLPPEYVPNPLVKVRSLSESDPLPGEALPAACSTSARSGISAVLDFSDCPHSVLMTTDTPWGTVAEVANVPLQDIVSRQFGAVALGIFRAPGSSDCPEVTFKVSSMRTVLKQIGSGRVKSRVEFRVNADGQNVQSALFECVCSGQAEGPWDGACVPFSVYQSVRQAAESFRADLLKRLYVFDKVAEVSAKGRPVRGPSFLSFEMKPMSEDGIFGGNCRLACNDWDSARAANWLRAKLDDRSREQLGIPLERVRVIYIENSFDAEKGEWRVSFKTFARVPWFLDYDQYSRTGICAVDLELANLTAQQGAEKMKEYVMQEMNRRGVVVVDGKKADGAGVRFDKFETDERYNVIRCTFKLVK